MVHLHTGAAFEDAMEYALALWRVMCPDEVLEFENFMRYQRAEGEENGFWSEGRHFKHVGECPAFIHARIAERIENFDWYQDKKLRDQFFSRFAQFRMDPTRFSGTAQSSRA